MDSQSLVWVSAISGGFSVVGMVFGSSAVVSVVAIVCRSGCVSDHTHLDVVRDT